MSDWTDDEIDEAMGLDREEVEKGDPDQPREEDGKWTDGGGGGAKPLGTGAKERRRNITSDDEFEASKYATPIGRKAYDDAVSSGKSTRAARAASRAAFRSAFNSKLGKSFTLTAEICKTDEDQRLVFGFFSIAKIGNRLVSDGEADEIEPAELEKAAYAHVLDARLAGENHVRKGVGRLVESFYFSPDKLAVMAKTLAASGIVAKLEVGACGWWGGYRISDDAVWKKIKSGEYAAFSIGGRATRTED